MVKGIDIFREYFRDHSDKYVLIGGTACDISMTEIGLDFRATKDLDMVLIIEAVDPQFASLIWDFVKSGGYQNQQKNTNRRLFYRFYDPSENNYPYMLELFSRIPDALANPPKGNTIPIRISDEISSLSAILLDDDYYDFIKEGITLHDELSVLRPEYLIILKAKAYLNLKKQKQAGQPIDSKDIKKHRNDVFRLYQTLNPEMSINLPPALGNDLFVFVQEIKSDTIDLKAMGLRNITMDTIIQDLAHIYHLTIP